MNIEATCVCKCHDARSTRKHFSATHISFEDKSKDHEPES